MSRFAEQAQQLLDAASAASARGEACPEMTILIGSGGGIEMIANSDWPLDSLMLERGARAVYRVTDGRGVVRVEGRDGSRRCVLEAAIKAGRGAFPARF